jgi:thioredoxin 1
LLRCRKFGSAAFFLCDFITECGTLLLYNETTTNKEVFTMSAISINKDNFQEEVLNSDKPVLLDFWAPWCGPCRMVAPIVEEIAEERPDIKVGKVNVDEAPALAARFGISSIPFVARFENGKPTHSALGFMPATALADKLGI